MRIIYVGMDVRISGITLDGDEALEALRCVVQEAIVAALVKNAERFNLRDLLNPADEVEVTIAESAGS